jgi:hypothetical protein
MRGSENLGGGHKSLRSNAEEDGKPMEGESFVTPVETLERGSIPHAEEDPEVE